MEPTRELLALAHDAALQHGLEPTVVCALIEQESAWDTFAIRFEPGFHRRYVAPLGLPPTEEMARSFSWGLMQVMGQVAREHNFGDPFISALCEPSTGLAVGCRVFAAKIQAADGNLTAGLALWNGGANPQYPGEVLSRQVKYSVRPMS